MKNALKIHFIIYLLLSSISSLAQDYFEVRGYVTNPSNEPLIGVYVRAVNLGIGAVTNEEGQYELRLIEGLHRLSFTHIGYESKQINIPTQKNQVLNVVLKPTENELGAVEVSNKRNRVRLGIYYVVAQSNTQGFSTGFKFSIVPYNNASNSWSF